MMSDERASPGWSVSDGADSEEDLGAVDWPSSFAFGAAPRLPLGLA